MRREWIRCRESCEPASRLVEILVAQDAYPPCAHLLLLFRFVRGADAPFFTQTATVNGYPIWRRGLQGEGWLKCRERVRGNEQQPKYQRDDGWFIRFHALTLQIPLTSLLGRVRWIL